MKVAMPCLRTDEAHAFADDELSPEQTATFREHLRGCEQCRAIITGNWQLNALLREAVKDGAEPFGRELDKKERLS